MNQSSQFGIIKTAFVCLLFVQYFDGTTVVGQSFPVFKAVTIDPQIDKVCYGLTVADVNGDGRPDLVGVSDRAVYWYENPSWKRHRIIADQTVKDNVCIAPLDIDQDGAVDFALGAGWTGTGTIQWLRRGKTLEDKWSVHPIATERWTHRMRFADVLGKGRPQLVVTPLNATVGKGVRLMAFTIPKNPTMDRWVPVVLSDRLNRVHNHWHVDFDENGTVDTIAASQEGITLITSHAGSFQSKTLNSEAAGEVKFGSLGKKQPFMATIEPMHGTRAVVYTQKKEGWDRTVLDESLQQGHAVWMADLNGDMADEVIIGHRAAGKGDVKGPGLYAFQLDQQSGQWKKHVIDNGGCAVEDAIAADFNGDGKIDIAAGGRATHNVVIYFNGN
ncbi:MAG: VCBS repeat-containing protein [Pirellulaceae bacterium]|nr:VCBS repeat-containing protein [Pirellulaceae bacterium]